MNVSLLQILLQLKALLACAFTFLNNQKSGVEFPSSNGLNAPEEAEIGILVKRSALLHDYVGPPSTSFRPLHVVTHCSSSFRRILRSACGRV